VPYFPSLGNHLYNKKGPKACAVESPLLFFVKTAGYVFPGRDRLCQVIVSGALHEKSCALHLNQMASIIIVHIIKQIFLGALIVAALASSRISSCAFHLQ
jgi:hypothetical protein